MSPNPPVRVALIGTGDIGHLHAAALSAVPGAELVVTTGRDPAAAAGLAAEFDAPLAGDERAVLADHSITAVDICVPNHLHEEFVRRALDAGKHVLCEKPIALDLPAARRMRDAAEAADRILMIGTTLRYWPCYRRAHDHIRSGAMGRVLAFSARRMLSLLRAVDGRDGWRHDQARSGGAVIDLQVHDIDFALWTFGRPETVTSRGVRSPTGAWDHVWTLLGYPDLTVSVESSFMLQGDPVTMDFRALGADESISFTFVQSDFAMHHIEGTDPNAATPGSRLMRFRWEQDPVVLAADPEDPVAAALHGEIAAFVAAVRTGDTNGVPTAAQGVDALEVALASRTSCETGVPVALPLP